MTACALLTSCKFGEVTVPRGEAVVVVHAVLNPSYFQQVFLVERALTGAVNIDTLVPFDPADPVRTGRGVAVSNARVVLSDDTLELVALEDRTPVNPRGAGVYRLNLTGRTQLQPGKRYTLTVTTPQGEVVRGSTTIPKVAPAPGQVGTVPFDRDLDTLRFDWTPVTGARTYMLFAESPFGAFNLFLDSLQVRLPGSLRNIFANEIPRVFFPGFQQQVVVAAVDTNYYDYYRSRNDPFTGSGIVNHLEGGVGVVGSVVPIARRTLAVGATMRAPIEGHYVRGNTAQNFLGAITLYIESPPANGNPAALSGSWVRQGTSELDGFIGTLQGKQVRLALLNQWSANDTIGVINAEWRGDSLVGSFVQGGAVVLVKRP
ncbi:MAG TPA: DUF4249 family protein [Gemmatimonadaceae bacterium]